MGYRVYTVMMAPVSVSTAKTLIQIRAGSSAALQISKAWIFQRGSATNQQLAAKLSRWATAGYNRTRKMAGSDA